MSLLSNNKKNDKKGKKNPNSASGSKFILKPGTAKASGFSKKPVKTGGSRGS